MTTAATVEPRSSMVEALAGEMVDRWAHGERPLAEEYFCRFPELLHSPIALELIAEELALRQEYNLPISVDELVARFPAWQVQVRALAQCQQVLGPVTAPRFPKPGDTLDEFKIVSLLGRGAHGRVFLATQTSLGGRPVVLKLSPSTSPEHLSLARLQHTHIVPLYSAHEFLEKGLHGLCLPYFGGITLDRVSAGIRDGAGLLAVLQELGSGELAPAVHGPAWELLERASYPDAVAWIGVCLADALHYAHGRGLLHLDVKPSNVLLAADGVPMLLDFHISRPPLQAGAAPPPWLGGTPGYMPPEHEAAFAAVQSAAPVPKDLDGRADVYALGMVLEELLRGISIPTGLADILARCTAAEPAERYPTAAALAADLRRHLADLPLRGVANRSLRERWRKWRRRRPLSFPLILAAGSLVLGGVAFLVHSGGQAMLARMALSGGETHLREGRYAEAVEAFRGGDAILNGVPFESDLRSRLREARRAAERRQAAHELHAVCELVRPLYAETVTPRQADAVANRCRELWAHRQLFARTLTNPGDSQLTDQWRTDLIDLAVLLAHLEVILAPKDLVVRRQALAILDEAERLCGPNVAIDLERARHASVLGITEFATAADRRARSRPAHTTSEHLALARVALATGDLTCASAEAEQALQLSPGSFWANYYRGSCSLRNGEPAEALAAFSACLALAPEHAWCLHNRGLAFAGLGRLEQARADFDRALALDRGFAAAHVGLAMINHRLGRHADALVDLRHAAEAGYPAPAVDYQRAVVLIAMADQPAAVRSLRSCLANDTNHRAAQDLLTKLTGGR